jgi:hypothetical protein
MIFHTSVGAVLAAKLHIYRGQAQPCHPQFQPCPFWNHAKVEALTLGLVLWRSLFPSKCLLDFLMKKMRCFISFAPSHIAAIEANASKVESYNLHAEPPQPHGRAVCAFSGAFTSHPNAWSHSIVVGSRNSWRLLV